MIVSIDEQSPNIAQGVDASEEVRGGSAGEDQLNLQGAGDQGMMFGFACDETPDLLPLPIWTAHRLAERLAEVRKSGQVPYLRPDGKTQVTYEYEDGRPVGLKTVLISTQHQEGVDRDTVIRPDLIEQVIRPVIPEQFADDEIDVWINPTGTFVLGGPHADCGLTGRKIIVDTYGGMGRHGGGAFSGKDPSKVDRSGAYAARWVAKHVVASGAATRCEVQVAYAIGVAHPMSILVETFGTNVVAEDVIEKAVRDVFDLRPGAIVRDLDLKRPIYRDTAAYGHFGRQLPGFSWEHTTRLDDFKSAVGAPDGPPECAAAECGRARTDTRMIARVVPDVTGLDKEFDYLVPDELADASSSARWCGCRCTARGSAAGSSSVDPAEASSGPERMRPLAKVSSRGTGGRRSSTSPAGRRCAGPPGGCGRSSSRPARRTTWPACRRRGGPVAARSRRARRRRSCWPTAAGCCGRPPSDDVVPALLAAVGARAGAGRRAVGRSTHGSSPIRLRRAGLTVAVRARRVGPRRRRCRRRHRRPRRGLGAVPRPRRGRGRRRARRVAAGGAQPDVARPRRGGRAGPAGRARRCC